MIKTFNIIFISFFLSCSFPKNTSNNQKTQLQVCNIFNDTTGILLDKITILIFIKEPCCTGCKENLAEYLNKLSKKYHQYIILGKSENLLDKKIYIRYINSRFKNNLGTFFSLSYKNFIIKINQKEYLYNTIKSPFIMVITKGGKTVDTYEYEKIFSNVFVKKSFKMNLKHY